MFFSISLSFLYHQQATNIKTNRVTLTKSWLLACVCQLSGFITAGFSLSRAIPNCVSRTFPASESNNLYCKEIGHLHEPESLSPLVVLSRLSILFVYCLHEPQMHKYLETKEGENSILLKFFRFSRNCRVPLISFIWNTWHYNGQDTNKHTWKTEELWQENPLLIHIDLHHPCAACKAALWKNKMLHTFLLWSNYQYWPAFCNKLPYVSSTITFWYFNLCSISLTESIWRTFSAQNACWESDFTVYNINAFLKKQKDASESSQSLYFFFFEYVDIFQGSLRSWISVVQFPHPNCLFWFFFFDNC